MYESDNIIIADHSFKIVSQIPSRYKIWPADFWTPENGAPANLLPMCLMNNATKEIELSSLVAIETEFAPILLQAAHFGCRTLGRMEGFLAQHHKPAAGSYLQYQVETVKNAIRAYKSLMPADVLAKHTASTREATITNKLYSALNVINVMEPTAESLQRMSVTPQKFNEFRKCVASVLKDHIKEVKKELLPIKADTLRFTRGTPLYIRFLNTDATSGRRNGWTIVEGIHLDAGIIDTSHFGSLCISNYGTTWEAYDKAFTPHKKLH